MKNMLPLKTIKYCASVLFGGWDRYSNLSFTADGFRIALGPLLDRHQVKLYQYLSSSYLYSGWQITLMWVSWSQWKFRAIVQYSRNVWLFPFFPVHSDLGRRHRPIQGSPGESIIVWMFGHVLETFLKKTWASLSFKGCSSLNWLKSGDGLRSHDSCFYGSS